MAKRIALTALNAKSVDVVNTIRANASAEYQTLVPEIKTAKDLPTVGEVLYGYPAMANQFLTALVNRIALVNVRSAQFNNAYAELKKGMLEFGETVEEVFVNITKAQEFSVEKAEAREFKRSLPDVRTAFHVMNYRVMYPVTIQDEDLRMAFLTPEGVTDLIAKIVASVSVAAEYDEYLLFKYLIIKGIAKGQIKKDYIHTAVTPNAPITDDAVKFRGLSNMMTFMSTKYNQSGVHTVTGKEDQCIFMDAQYNAKFDVNVLASAFNMDKADFMGRLFLIDSFTTFDNERFDVIRENSDMLEEVTEEELTALATLKALVVDKEWFQVYDNQAKFTEKYVASGEYWNYFYHVWKTVSSSPFSNAVAIFDTQLAGGRTGTPTVVIDGVSVSANGETASANVHIKEEEWAGGKFVQTEDAVTKLVGVHPYGALITTDPKTTINAVYEIDGVQYKTTGEIGFSDEAIGTELKTTKL